MAAPGYELLDDLVRYTGFDDEDRRLLRELGPLLEPHFGDLVERFYEAAQANAATAAVLQDEAQLERLKVSLRKWLERLFEGIYDEAYFEQRARIGHAHVRVGLAPRYVFGAMSLLRGGLHQALRALEEPPVKRGRAHEALDRILDIELAIMLETYSEDYVGRMRAAERLATLGQLAASIGHELRNPLAVIETSLHLLRRRGSDDERVRRHLDRISDQVQVSSQIIEDLLQLARDREPMRRHVDIAEIVRKTAGDLPGVPHALIELDLPSGLPPANVDPGQFRQLLMNLLQNAVQAVAQVARGRVIVQLEALGDDLRVRIDDNGPGLTPEVLARAFEPLFTTRAKGIGLGLALCKQIVDRHGGLLVAGNLEGGVGARFEVCFPGALAQGTADSGHRSH